MSSGECCTLQAAVFAGPGFEDLVKISWGG